MDMTPTADTLLYHITSQHEWAAATAEYTAPSLATEGFIHCSTVAQVVATANRFYRGQSGLVLLAIDPTRLHAPVRYEPPAEDPASPERFPHLYGALNVDAVRHVVPFAPAADGTFALPNVPPNVPPQ